MAKVLFFIFIAILIAIGTIYSAGKFSDPNWFGVKRAIFDEQVEILFQVATDPVHIKRRKRDVLNIEIIENDGGLITWRENLTDGRYRIFEELEKETPKRVAIELIESSNGVTGLWEYNFKSYGSGTEIIIEEESNNPDLWARGVMVLRGRDTLLRQEITSIRKGLLDYLIKND